MSEAGRAVLKQRARERIARLTPEEIDISVRRAAAGVSPEMRRANGERLGALRAAQVRRIPESDYPKIRSRLGRMESAEVIAREYGVTARYIAGPVWRGERPRALVVT